MLALCGSHGAVPSNRSSRALQIFEDATMELLLTSTGKLSIVDIGDTLHTPDWGI